MPPDQDDGAGVSTRVITSLGGAAIGAAPVPAKLVVVNGPDEGTEQPLQGSVTIGSDKSCDLVLTDSAVSRKHVRIDSVAGLFKVRDLGSRNGTFLGGTRISDAAVPLGAVVQLGESAIAVQPRFYMREVAPTTDTRFGDLYGKSLAMREVFAMLARVAPSDINVLVEGESGTGKELAARSIHAASSRASKPYVVFDCTSIPRELAESELFGHKRGAFSGATDDRLGAFQQADGGTICLDEIGELPLDLQPKLLRVLETGEVRRVGDDDVKRVDVRVVAATNRDLGAEARRGNFRSDLYYRLEVMKVRMPPLRHRPEDIAGLVTHLLRGKLADAAIEGDNLKRLVSYTWPGNVRELRNVLERAVAFAGPNPTFAQLVFNLGPMTESPATIGISFPGVATPMPFKDAKGELLAQFERAYVEGLLARHKGNVSQAAAAAQLSRKHLYDLIKRATGDDREDG